MGFILLFAIFFLPLAVSAQVQIEEIAWMGTLPKVGETAQAASNNEWIEFYNSGGSAISLDGWVLEAKDGFPKIELSGSIAAGEYFLMERGNDEIVSETADLIYPFKNNALSNTGEDLVLKDSGGEIIDSVNASSGWPSGDNTTKDTMQRSGQVWITAVPTPKRGNAVPSAGAGGKDISNIPPIIPAPEPPRPNIHADAGDDMTVLAGSSVEFEGRTIGLKGNLIAPQRALWNWGDGGFSEGERATHIFQNPGTYTVGLHVVSGEYSGSDYAVVTVVSNQLQIVGVVGGREGFVRLRNPAGVSFDIGGWILRDDEGKEFILPRFTRIGARAEIAFSNSTTGLLQSKSGLNVRMHFPNHSLALEWIPPERIASAPPSAKSAEPEIQENREVSPASVTSSATVSPAFSAAAANSLVSEAESGPGINLGLIGAFSISAIGALGFFLLRKRML